MIEIKHLNPKKKPSSEILMCGSMKTTHLSTNADFTDNLWYSQSLVC